MSNVQQYQEFMYDLPSAVTDLLDLRDQVKTLIGERMDVSYAPVSTLNHTGPNTILFRAAADAPSFLPDEAPGKIMTLQTGDVLHFSLRARLLQSDRHHRQKVLISQGAALSQAYRFFIDNGFDDVSIHAQEHFISMPGMTGDVTYPYWYIWGQMRVRQAESTIFAMVNGFGRSRGLGFGMIMLRRNDGTR